MTFFADLSCSWPTTPSIHLQLDATSFSVAVAMLEAWSFGFQVGCGESVTLKCTNLASKKPRGAVYLKMTDAAAIAQAVHP